MSGPVIATLSVATRSDCSSTKAHTDGEPSGLCPPHDLRKKRRAWSRLRSMRTLLPLLRPTAALRRLGVQWAFVALLAAALMPTLARLAAPSGPADWAAICQSTPQSSGDAHALGDACALCSLSHATPALTGATAPAVAAVAYAPPVPSTAEPVRGGIAQARAPSARAPPRSA